LGKMSCFGNASKYLPGSDLANFLNRSFSVA
jgi:hypothetical protein